MKTKHAIEYQSVPSPIKMHIPKGTPVIEASNLPSHDGQKRYWAEPWDGMTEWEESWQRTYGFLLEAEEIEE